MSRVIVEGLEQVAQRASAFSTCFPEWMPIGSSIRRCEPQAWFIDQYLVDVAPGWVTMVKVAAR